MDSPDEVSAYVSALEEERREKDAFFARSPHSPIPAPQRRGFTGLRYFPPDPALRVVATVESLASGGTYMMQTSDNDVREYEVYALLRFTLDGQERHLTAYRTPDAEEDEAWFVPFRDAQAGKETYGAGRYLEIEPPHAHEHEHGHKHEAGAGEGSERVIIDFNLAYNPYCAYSPYYSCPLPPPENTLPIAIRAGEMTYAGH
jgi:uncharacterized protein (DUF1684 family)